jgi:hypothetical protein
METEVKPPTMCDVFNRMWTYVTYDLSEELPKEIQEQYSSRIAEIIRLRSTERQFMKSYILLHALHEEVRIEAACTRFQAMTAGEIQLIDGIPESILSNQSSPRHY